MANDLRDRYAEAIRESAFPGLSVQGAASAVLAVRDDELEQAQDLARKRGDHAILIGQALDLSQAKLGQAEVALETLRAQLGDHGGGALHFNCVPVGRVAEKISEKLNALAQREQAVNDCRVALATLARVRDLAEQWATFAPADVRGLITADVATADAGRSILAVLDQPADGGQTPPSATEETADA